MLTYTEYCLQKQAVEEDQPPNIYADYKAKAEAGDTNAQKILDTPISTEYGWGLLGAGLGAGGGYLLSKRLRRNATKRQRALDVILGALAGGGLTLLAGNTITDDTGLSFFQKNRLDEHNPNKNNYSDGTKKQKSEDISWQDLGRNTTRYLSRGAGAFIGQHIGDKVLPFDTLFTTGRLKKLAPAYAKKDPAAFTRWRASEAVIGGKNTKGLIAGDPLLRFERGLGSGVNRLVGLVPGYYIGGKIGDEWLGPKLFGNSTADAT